MSDMRIAVMGVAGRMGRTLVANLHRSKGCVLAGAVEAPGAPTLGLDAGELAGLGPLGVTVSEPTLDLFVQVDGILDFSTPSASVAFAGLAAQARIVHVIGTTGFTPADEAKIAAAARHATIVKAGNMSLGVNLLVALAERVAKALDADFDIEVLEMHHRHKVDAPSGTALMLGEAAARGRGAALEERAVRGRDGHTGERGRGDIGFASLRGGSVVGDHKVIFAGEGERLELSHKAESRDIFARGAVTACLWGRGRPPGLYAMTDVLGL